MHVIGFGGGCHWCTEAVFQILKGVDKVEQGWISSNNEHFNFSEAVIVHYNETDIDLATLIEVHLYTHSCTSDHPLRNKYRSAVYTFSENQVDIAHAAIDKLQFDFEDPILTKVIPFKAFRLNKEDQLNYFRKYPNNQFCQRYIHPKLKFIIQNFKQQVRQTTLIQNIDP